MRRKRKKSTTSNLAYLRIFAFTVVLFALLSITVQAFQLWRGRGFSGSTFTFLLISQTAHIVRIDTNEDRIIVITIRKGRDGLIDKDRLENSILLGVPIDGIVAFKKARAADRAEKESAFLSLDGILQMIAKRSDYRFVNINTFDLIKIYLLSLSISDSNSKTFEVGDIQSFTGAKNEVDETMYEYFRDEAILNEGLSIEVVNGTGIDGLGGKITRMLKNVGFNVISITTGDEGSSKIIYRMRYNSTVKRLASIFPISLEYKNETDVADITVVLGYDMSEKLKNF